jgi:ABC-type antimicrobial peptide transport system permease subunit
VRDASVVGTAETDGATTVMIGAQVAVTSLVLFLSAMGIFSLISVSVSRRALEIGLRAALGANPRHVLGSVL